MPTKALSLLACALLTAGAVYAQPTTYEYIGPNYDMHQVFGAYTTAMRLTGSFTVPNPLPPNMPLTDIGAQVTTASFFDGVKTRTESDSVVLRFLVRTNAAATIDRWGITLWEAGTTPEPEDPTAFHGFDSVWNPDPALPPIVQDLGDDAGELSCFNPAESCLGAVYPEVSEGHAGEAGNPPLVPGVWTIQGQTGPTAIPTLSPLWAAALVLLLMGGGLLVLR